MLSVEGGPGFSTTADRSARIQLWRPLSARRDLLLVDLRGTGRSEPLDCPAFRHHILGYIARAARCAAQLGPARDAYDTSQSVQDLAAVLRALSIGRVDLYGDSYGSYAAQAFALRYPGKLRSLVLDGTYQLPGSDPALADLAASTRSSLRLACGRRPGCPAGRTDPVRAVERLVAQVRQHPIVGTAPDGDGTPTHVRVDEDALVQVLMSGFYYQGVWRDILAAARSARAGDPQPLLRLAAETVTTDGPNGDPRLYSESLYLAVICHDYPELWGPSTPISQRPAEVRSALAAYPAGTFAPFSAAAWTGTDFEGALACLRWPSPARPDPPAPPAAAYPRVPTLILNGDLDNITPLADATVVARRFPRSTLVDVENAGHVTALLDQNDCASVIYLHFVSTLGPGDTSCAHRTPEVRVVPAFARSASAVAPARAGRRDALDAARPAGGRGGGRDRGRRPPALVGQLRRHGSRPSRRPVVVLGREPDDVRAPARRVRARSRRVRDGALDVHDRPRPRRAGRPRRRHGRAAANAMVTAGAGGGGRHRRPRGRPPAPRAHARPLTQKRGQTPFLRA